MMLNVFGSDAFSFTKLVAAINLIPHVPTRLGQLGIFGSEGVDTLTVAIEMENNALTLVPTAARGAPGVVKGVQRRNIRDFRPVHLPQRVAIMADEVSGLRAFGSETEEELAMGRLNKKFMVARRDLDITHEFQRMGAMRGVVLDSDATTVIYNFGTEFGVTPGTANIALSNTATKVLQEVIGLKGTIEDVLGGVMYTGMHALCSKEFFAALTSHPAVTETYRYQMSSVLREDRRYTGFEFGGVFWEEYRGSVGATRFIAANKALLFPMGVPDMFKSYFSPAPYMETVNTIGLPFYAKSKDMDFDKGVEWEVQSNPLHINTRPNAVLELTAT